MVVAVAFVAPAVSAQERPVFKRPQAQPGEASRTSKRKPELPSDGTWREDGQDLILNINGQVLRLRKSPSVSIEEPRTFEAPSLKDTPAPGRPLMPAAFFTQSVPQTSPSGGTLVGRLTNRGHPLVHCEVSLTPMRRKLLGYQAGELNQNPQAETDAEGNYRFENLPAGLYKLRWRPQGEEAWIRRIEYRPDVTVKTGETARIREIRTALRTLN